MPTVHVGEGQFPASMHEGLWQPFAGIKAVIEEHGGAEKIGIILALIDLETGGVVSWVEGPVKAAELMLGVLRDHVEKEAAGAFDDLPVSGGD